MITEAASAATTLAPPSIPSIRLFGLEPIRAAFEYAGMRRMLKAKKHQELPRGDGHPIVIFPGLASDGTVTGTGPLRDFLRGLGYTVYDWGRGFNAGPKGDVAEWLRELAEDIRQMVHAHKDEGVTLLGWSLGGIYAREVAKHIEREVRQVITIASPFAGNPELVRVGLLWRLVNGRPMPRDEALQQQLRTAPAVPTTSIYSRTDGVVAWQACIQPGEHAHVEHIEVEASHCGICWHPEVLRILADRLRRPVAAWKQKAKENAMTTTTTTKHKHHGKALITLTLGSALAFGAMAQTGLPAVKRSGSVDYVSGGIGCDESTALKAASASWPLTLEFGVDTKPRADYASDVAVTIRDTKGTTALQVTANGPLLLVKLPPGAYSVEATFAGRTITQQVSIARGKAAHQAFIWPAAAS